MRKPTLRDFMTPSPHTIGDEQTLAAAHQTMRTHRIRHLPVLRQGKLVGLLSERDLLFIEGLRGVDANRVMVEEAMSEMPIALSPATALEWVAAEMAQRKIGSVVVVEDDQVIGLFTTIDALHALQTLLARARRRSRTTEARSVS